MSTFTRSKTNTPIGDRNSPSPPRDQRENDPYLSQGHQQRDYNQNYGGDQRYSSQGLQQQGHPYNQRDTRPRSPAQEHYQQNSTFDGKENNYRNHTQSEIDNTHLYQVVDYEGTKRLRPNVDSSKWGGTSDDVHNERNEIQNHNIYLKDHDIWTSFPLGERVALKSKNFLRWKPQATYVDYILSGKGTPHEYNQQKILKQILRVNILETSQLELDRYVIHPFVRIHVIDMYTGKYIKKVDKERTLGENENMTRVVEGGKKFEDDWGVDFIPPFATNCCDLRVEGTARARWNHCIVLNETAQNFLDPKVIIIFEILDFNKELIREDSKKLSSDNLYRVAWGYLRPGGLAKNHIGLSKVQLFKYKFSPSQTIQTLMRKTHKRVPAVYFDFIWPEKTNYDGYLSVQINCITRPPFTPAEKFARSIFEMEKEEKDQNLSTGFHKKKVTTTYQDLNDPEFLKKRKTLARRSRQVDDECRVPTEVLFRFQSAPMGCFRLAFSPNGKYLAAACTYENSKTVIKIFNVEDGVLKYTLKGHKNLVHDLDWHSSNNFLISSSSDFTSKVWKIPENEAGDIDEDESERLLFICTLFHPSYVYSAKFLKDREFHYRKLVIASACFDAKVRVWRVDFEEDKYAKQTIISEGFLNYEGGRATESINLLEHRHPNILRFDETGRLYIGDSLGSIHIWDLHVKFDNISVSKLKEIGQNELVGDPINQLHILPTENKKLLVHSRDNCIRHIDYSHLSGVRVLGRYFGAKSSKFPIRSTISPDGQYVLSGSEDGKMYLWDFTTTEPYDTAHLGLSFVGPVTDVDWNNNYHMFAVSGFGDQYPILIYGSEVQNDEGLGKVLSRLNSYDEHLGKVEGNDDYDKFGKSFDKGYDKDGRRTMDSNVEKDGKRASSRDLDRVGRSTYDREKERETKKAYDLGIKTTESFQNSYPRKFGQ